MKTTTEIRAEKNMTFLKSNRELIITEINDIMGYFPYRTYNVSLKETMTILANEVSGYADYSIDNLSCLIESAIVTAKDNRVLGQNWNSEDFSRAAARRQGINL